MERYHIYKLGLAVLFYAVYCRRPLFTNGLEFDDVIENVRNTTGALGADEDYYVYYQGVQGTPGVDFPVYSSIPRTTFTCRDVESGYYADLETDCQVFHICNEGRKISFLCPNGTVFQQSDLICEWWFKVNCTNSPNLYEESAEQLREDLLRRKSSRRVTNLNHGAVMRTEERSSVSTSTQVKVHKNKRVEEQDGRNFVAANSKGAGLKSEAAENYGKGRSNGQTKNGVNRQFSAADEQSSKTANNGNSRGGVRFNSGREGNNFDRFKPLPLSRSNGQQVQQNQGNQNSYSDGGTFMVPKSFFEGNTNEQANVQYKGRGSRNEPTDTNVYAKSINYNTKAYATTPPPAYNSRKQGVNPKPSTAIKQKSTVPLTLNDIRVRKIAPGESEESQITEETASFYKNTLNSIQQANKQNNNPYPNHRETYSEIKDRNGKHPTSTTSSLPTTKAINNGKPFVGDRLSPANATNNAARGGYVQSRNALFAKIEGQADGGDQADNKTVIYCCSGNASNRTAKSEVITSRPQNSGLAYVGEEYVNISVPRFSTGYVKVGGDKTNRVVFGDASRNSVGVTSKPQTGFAAGNEDAFTTTTNKYIPVLSEKFNVNSSKASSNGTKKGNGERITLKLTAGFGGGNSYQTAGQKRPVSSANAGGFATAKSVDYAKTAPPIYGRTQTRPLPFSGTFNVPTTTPNTLYTSASPNFPAARGGGYYITKSKAETYTIAPAKSVSSFSELFTNSPRSAKTSNYIPTVPSISENKVSRPKPFELPSTQPTPQVSNLLLSSTTTRSISEKNAINVVDATTKLPILSYRLSSASPFSNAATEKPKPPSPAPTLPTPYTTRSPNSQSVHENVDNMIGALMKIASAKKEEDKTSETPRPGLIIPPSAGPQTLHTLAVYFANALDDIVTNRNTNDEDKNGTSTETLTTEQTGDARAINSLLTSTTVNKYNELFKEKTSASPSVSSRSKDSSSSNDSDLEGQNSKYPIETTPRVRQLARVFTQALSAYLDDPATFKKVLEEVRPTEPPPIDDPTAGEEDEVLSFSDADIKVNRPPLYTTTPKALSASPTWGYILAFNKSSFDGNSLEVRNSLSPDRENLQGADSQSFVPRYNSIKADEEKTTAAPTILAFTARPFSLSSDDEERNTVLPEDHWTTSPDVAKLWQTTLSVNPVAINSKLETTASPPGASTLAYETTLDDSSKVDGGIRYDLRALPKIELNATQVHGLLIDFMNTTNAEETHKLQRILRKLNTSENEFLDKMKEIEANPLTRRLILLLISECGMNVTRGLETREAPAYAITVEDKPKAEALQTSSSNGDALAKSNSSFKKYVDKSLDDDEQDTRALQLLNSLYSIASRWGK